MDGVTSFYNAKVIMVMTVMMCDRGEDKKKKKWVSKRKIARLKLWMTLGEWSRWVSKWRHEWDKIKKKKVGEESS